MEKSLFNQVGEVKGRLSENEESFSFQFTPQNENLRRTRGSLFTLVTIEGNNENRFEKAKAYYHEFQSTYYAKASGSIINSLSETLDQLEKDFAKKEEEGLKYDLIAAVFWGAVLYLAKTGTSSVWVSRGEKLKKIDFNKVASGVLEEGDTVVLVSEKFEKSVAEEELAKWLALEKFEKVLEEIDKKASAVEAAACLVIRLSVHDPEEEVKVAAAKIENETQETESENKEEKQEEQEQPVEESEEVVQTGEGKEETAQFVPPSAEVGRQVRNFLEAIQPVFFTLGKLGQRVITRLASPWRKRQPGELVDHVAIRRQRLGQVVLLILLVLVISLSFRALQRGEEANQEAIEALIASAQEQLIEARNIKTIDPNRASTLVSSAKEDLEDAKKLGDDPRIDDLESQAAELVAEITRSYQADQLETIFDFSRIESGTKIRRLALSGGLVMATDPDKNNLFSLDLNSRRGAKVEGAFTRPQNIASYQDGFYVQTQTGVLGYKTSLGRITSLADNSNWGEIIGAATFQSNLYLLDKGSNEIWRYLSTSAGLSSGRAYISGEKPDLSRASDIAIDDFVWVVTEDGRIYKFAQGRLQGFAVRNMSEKFERVVSIYTNSKARNLYLLDQGKGRLVVLSKDGVYQAQYGHDDLRVATSVVVNEETKTAYLSTQGKVVSLELR